MGYSISGVSMGDFQVVGEGGIHMIILDVMQDSLNCVSCFKLLFSTKVLDELSSKIILKITQVFRYPACLQHLICFLYSSEVSELSKRIIFSQD